MLSVHPWARTCAALLVIASVFLATRPIDQAITYALVLAAVCAAGLVRQHAQFLVTVGIPLLIALLVIWGYLVEPPSSNGQNRFDYVLLIWLRVAAAGGALQWMLLPLVEQPLHLRAFLSALRLSGSIGTLLVTPILFLPEVRRRLARIIDARKAQGLPTRGLAGLRAMPWMLMPLISSLIESSLARAELWSHRGLLTYNQRQWATPPWSSGLSAVVALLTFAALLQSVLQWI